MGAISLASEKLVERFGVDYAQTPAEDFGAPVWSRSRIPRRRRQSQAQFTSSWMYDKQGLRLSLDGLGPGYAFEMNTLRSTLELFVGDDAARGVADSESALEKSTASRGLLAVQPNEADLYGYTDENIDARDAIVTGRPPLLDWHYGVELVRLRRWLLYLSVPSCRWATRRPHGNPEDAGRVGGLHSADPARPRTRGVSARVLRLNRANPRGRLCPKDVDRLWCRFNNQSAPIEPREPLAVAYVYHGVLHRTAGTFMVNWLAKATEALRGTPPPEPEPYEVACACTHRISGMRLPAFQVVRCNRCGNFVFVLPRDVYPKLKPKKKSAPKSSPDIRRDSSVTTSSSTPTEPTVTTVRRNLATGNAERIEVVEQPTPGGGPADCPVVLWLLRSHRVKSVMNRRWKIAHAARLDSGLAGRGLRHLEGAWSSLTGAISCGSRGRSAEKACV